jgi:hypothetical protein
MKPNHRREGISMTRFRNSNGRGRDELKLSTETIMLLHPLYIELIHQQHQQLSANEQKEPIVFLRDVIGQLEWYKSKLPGYTGNFPNSSRGGFEMNKNVLQEDMKDLIENASHRWIPTMYLFSHFLDLVLSDEFDTDVFSEFASFVYGQLSSKDQTKIGGKAEAKRCYPFIESTTSVDSNDNGNKSYDVEEDAVSVSNVVDSPQQTDIIVSSKKTKKSNVTTSPSSEFGIGTKRTLRSNKATDKVDKTINSAIGNNNETNNEKEKDEESKKSDPSSTSGEAPVRRTKSVEYHNKIKKEIEDWLKDGGAVSINQQKVIRLLYKGASLATKVTGKEIPNIISSIRINTKAMEVVAKNKEIITEIEKIIQIDEDVVNEDSSNTNNKKTSNNDNSNQSNGNNDSDDDDNGSSLTSSSESESEPRSRKRKTLPTTDGTTKRKKRG